MAAGRLLIRRSKTDPDGEGAVVFVSAQTMAALATIRNGAPGETPDIRAQLESDLTSDQEGSPRSRPGRRLQRGTRHVSAWPRTLPASASSCPAS